MSTLMELTVVLFVCPALLAVWADQRYPQLRPRELRRTALHLGLTGLLAFVVLRPALIGINMLLQGATARALAIAVACTIITYCITVSVWVARSAAELARTGR